MGIVAFLLGFVVVVWTLLSAIRTVVLPRATAGVLPAIVFLTTRRLFRVLAPERRRFAVRDRVMALYAPVSLLMLPAVWLSFVLGGFSAMFWALGGRSFSEAFAVSGSSLFTLGFSAVDSIPEHVLAFAEATLGLGLVALLITFLPSMYAAFSRRENRVALLEVRAGSPPSAVEMLLRFHRIGWSKQMDDLWREWEAWFADVEESHSSYPALAFFRSPQPDRSWVTAAGTVLDAAALSVSTLDTPPQPHAQLCIRAGYIALRRLAEFFGIRFDPDPAPDDPISITRSEYDVVYDQLTAAGVAVRPDRQQAWRDYAGWRVNYDTVLLALAELTVAPYAPWSSDRSTPSHVAQQVRRWGRGREER
jgi:hypothetical protein